MRLDCAIGTYGDDCLQYCGNCKYNETCIPYDGRCTNGCQQWWGGHTCHKEISTLKIYYHSYRQI